MNHKKYIKSPFVLAVMDYFKANPDEELLNDDIEAKFGKPLKRSIYEELKPAVKDGLLKTRKERFSLVYSIGDESLLDALLATDDADTRTLPLPLPAPSKPLKTTSKALQTQIGGNHYTKLAIQPMTFSMGNQLDACQHTIIKYVVRFRDKNGIEDLLKAKHVIDMLIDFESAKSKPAHSIITPAARERMESAAS